MESIDFPEWVVFLTAVLGRQSSFYVFEFWDLTNGSPWALRTSAFLVLRLHIPPDFP